jgi:hypothetical protein
MCRCISPLQPKVGVIGGQLAICANGWYIQENFLVAQFFGDNKLWELVAATCEFDEL